MDCFCMIHLCMNSKAKTSYKEIVFKPRWKDGRYSDKHDGTLTWTLTKSSYHNVLKPIIASIGILEYEVVL
jgi:hypothetical protein